MDGAAVLLMVADPQAIAVDGGEAPEQLHVTLGFLAQPAAEYDADRQAELIAALGDIADTLPATADAFGTATFNPATEDTCQVLLVQSEDLARLREQVCGALGEDLSTKWPVWVPHITLAYGTDAEIAVPEEPIGFDRLVLGWGDEQIDLNAPIETLVRRAARAIVERAQPAINLGQLEGVWAVVYARREAVEKLHGAALGDVMKALDRLDWGQILDAIDTELRIDPQISGRQLAAVITPRIENLITAELPAGERADWLAAMTSALTDATAEGQAAGMGLVADAAGVSINWDLAAEEAKAALEGSQTLADDAGTWIGKQVHGLGYQIGQKLASLWDDGADRATMSDAIDAILGGTNNAGLLLDTAIGRALAQGALATYAAAGVEYASFETAGDGRVCAVCAGYEDGGPYLLAACPQPPAHPSCRCTVSPSQYQPTSSAAAMLAAYADAEAEAA